ncbi:ABC transporter permease [Wielerella bovis]|uniref:ABC transporter permease n=1 Tax=Wielerella bovis TaxID=2917790 RepID=UPI0020193D72|nr:ABC transporter permease [Wielerella bovis]ULJ62466.1 ABC transporter permease [Wielerella bovis]
MNRTFKNIWALMRKEFRSVFGDKVLSVLIVLVFTGMVIQAANGISTDVKNATVGVIDLDHSTLSHRIVDSLLEPQFKKPVYIQREQADELMGKGQLIFVLEFPPNFEKDIVAGRAPEAQLLVDATTMTQAGIGQVYISQIFQREILAFTGQTQMLNQIMPSQYALNVLYNPNGESPWFQGVAQVNNMISMLALVLVGAAVIRERERGTIEHLLVMPVTASEIVLAKILANGLVVCVAATLSMQFVVGGVIGLPIMGNIGLYFFGTAVFMFSVASLAVMLATLAPTMPQYSLLMMPIYIVALLFSGSSSPRHNMPQAAQWVSEYWPTTQFATFAQNVIFRGAGLEIVYPQLLAMAIVGGVFLGFALFRFRKMLEKQG